MEKYRGPGSGLARSSALLATAAVLWAAVPVESYSLRVEYTYRVVEIQDSENVLNGTVAVGDEFDGVYNSDSRAPSQPTSPTDPRAIYYSDMERFPWHVEVGPFLHRSEDALPVGVGLTVVVICDGCGNWTAPPSDVYQASHAEATTRMVSPSDGGESYALLISRVFLHLEDHTALTIDTEAQPLRLDLADWPDIRAVWISGCMDRNDNGRVDRGFSMSDPGEPEFAIGGELIAIRVVVDPAEMARELVEAVIDLNISLGVANASDPALLMALKALDAVHSGTIHLAANSLRTFVNMVTARAGNGIPDEDAARLITLAEDLIEVLERDAES